MTNDEINRELTHASWRAVRPLFLAMVLVFVCIWAALAEAATVTIDTAAYQINLGTRNKIYFSRIGSVPLNTPCIDAMPALDAFVIADRMKVKLDAGRTSRPNQIFAKCGAPPPPPPPPVASLQVYACADAGADGRILESATVLWPNCVTASYQNPSKSLVVAINPDSPPLMWRLASKLTDERIWTQTDGVGAWTRATAINWGMTTPPPPPPPPAGSGNLTWTPSPSPNVAGYRLLYGTTPDALTLSVDVIPPEPRVFKVPGLKAGQLYHFRMQAYDSGGVHGPLSNLLSVTIQ